MLPRTTRPLTRGATAVLRSSSTPLSRVRYRDQGVGTETVRLVAVPDVVPGIVSEPAALGRGSRGCVPRQGDMVCADDASCICPMPGHVTDAERAVMNDIARQASHLTTVLGWLFAFVALLSLVLLMLR